ELSQRGLAPDGLCEGEVVEAVHHSVIEEVLVVVCPVGEDELVRQAGLARPRAAVRCPVRNHADFAGRVAAVDRAVLNDRHTYALAGSRHRSTQSGQAATDHDQIELVLLVRLSSNGHPTLQIGGRRLAGAGLARHAPWRASPATWPLGGACRVRQRYAATLGRGGWPDLDVLA